MIDLKIDGRCAQQIMGWLLTGLFLCGSAFGQPTGDSQPNPTQSQAIANDSPIPEYRLGFGDVIEIKFFNNERFNETVTVRPDGRISLQRVGDLQISGMTPTQLDSIITETYLQILINPDVTVFVRQFAGYNVYVLGEVNQPGGYPITRNMTLLQLLAEAGGTKDGAQLKSVMVLRPGENGDVSAVRVDLKKPMKGDHIPERYYVRSQDIVYVPKTFISNVSAFLKHIYDGVLPPLDVYSRVLFWSRQ